MSGKLIVGVLVVVVAIFGTFVASLGILQPGGCPAYSRTPAVNFAVAWDEANETVTVRHSGGNPLSPENEEQGTIALFITITDTETGANERFTWFNQVESSPESAGSFPVAEGDEFSITQHEINFSISTGDIVEVVWKGDVGYDQPFWCFHQGTGDFVIGRQTLQSHTEATTTV